MKPAIILPLAEDEVDEASRYYENQRPGLGDEFVSRLQMALRELAEHPGACPTVRGRIRRRLLHRFPYGVLFREDESEIVVVAAAHHRRRPGYWLPRLR